VNPSYSLRHQSSMLFLVDPIHTPC
jgi:hypothetical protein